MWEGVRIPETGIGRWRKNRKPKNETLEKQIDQLLKGDHLSINDFLEYPRLNSEDGNNVINKNVHSESLLYQICCTSTYI